jgi:ribosomal protein S1
MDVVNVHSVLDRLFAGCRSPERAAAWEVAKGRFVLGSDVEGVVVARFPFGVFVDIDAGFPALILVTRLRRRGDRRPYNSLERFPAIGSAVKARVCVWACSHRQIGLTQLEQEPMLGETLGGDEDRSPAS